MVTPAPNPFRPTRWPQIEQVAVRCLARLARPSRPAEVRSAELQRRADVAALVESRARNVLRRKASP